MIKDKNPQEFSPLGTYDSDVFVTFVGILSELMPSGVLPQMMADHGHQ